MSLSIPPISSNPAPQLTNSSPFLGHIKTKTPDSISSHKERAGPPRKANKAKAPLAIVCDFLDCIKHFILSAIHKIRRFFAPYLSQTILSPPLAPPIVIPHQTSRSPHPISDPISRIDPSLSIIQKEDLAFRQLALSEKDKENITYIINTLARFIILPMEDLQTRGDQIRHVHPFIFWEYVLTEENLAADIRTLKTRCFGIIWRQFSAECSEKLQAMDEKSLLAPYVNAFARSIQRDPQTLRDLMNISWMAFLNSLIDLSPQNLAYSPPGVSSSPLNTNIDSGAGTGHPISTGRLRHSPILTIGDPAATPTRMGDWQTEGTAFLQQPGSVSRTLPQKKIASLPITNLQKQKLRRLLTDISQNPPFMLALQFASLTSDWHALQDVHPLRLLWEVFSNPLETAKIHLILINRQKKSFFLNDFAYTLKTGAMHVELRPYFNDFTEEMKIREMSLERLTAGSRSEWRFLIKYLDDLKTADAVATTFSS